MRPRRSARSTLFSIITATAIGAGAALAVEPDERLADPALEARARALSAELRCLICQNQSIDDSNAPLARDLRLLVRERMQAGSSDGDIRSFLVERYGTFVLLRPPINAHTLLLWLTPLLVLGAVGFALRRRHTSQAAAGAADATRPLTADEQRRLDDILGGQDQ